MTLRTGEQYLAGLRDGRQVWQGGERVAAVPEHPPFAGCLQSLAEFYDRQHHPAHRPVMRYGEAEAPQSVAWAVPRSVEDLKRRRRYIDHVTRWHGGTMGRLPEYVPLVLWGLLEALPLLARRNPAWAQRLQRYYDACADRDLCLSHSFADPQIDRGKPSGDLERLRIVSRRGDDLVIAGAKTVATLAPFADEYLVLTPPRRGLVAEQALFLAVPIASPGLRLICRTPFSGPDAGPLASRFDEMDAWAVFDNVSVEAERVFLCEDLETLQRSWRHLTVWTLYHLLIRIAVKAETFLGVCGLITERIGTRVFQNVREDVSDLIRYLETLRAFLCAAETEARITPAGLAMPNPTTLAVGHMYAVEHFPQLLRTVNEVSGHSLLMAPAPTDLASPEVRADLERHFGGSGLDDKAKLFRLAWDLACSGFSGRQLLFESFNARSLSQNRLALVEHYDLTPYEALARELAGMPPADPAEQRSGGPPGARPSTPFASRGPEEPQP